MSSPPTPRFGALLKTLRTTAGLTQEALAERASMSVRGLRDLEGGQHQRPRRDTVELLAAALGLAGAERTTFAAAAQALPPNTGQPAAAVVPPFATGALVPLVGRAGELALLERFLSADGGALGTPPALVLAGEPGIGKTRLLQAAAQAAIAWGWCVLVGGGQRHGGQEPYTPVVEALDQHLQAAGPAHRRAALEGCGWLVRLLPELAGDLEPVPAGDLAPEQERRRLFAAVGRCLANVAGPAGTLLVLDDLQWAGSDALDLLASLLRSPALRAAGGAPPLRVVAAYRDTEVRPVDPLGLLLADLAQARLVRRHALGPLAPQEAAALLDELLVDLAADDRGQVDGVLRQAGDTPFFLISYAQALQQGSGAGVPWDLAQGVRQRVALLPAAGQELLGAAAVVGRHVSRALLGAVAEQPEEAALAGLEAACRARLLLEEGDDAYAFAHDVIREVVEADLGAARRAVLHRKVAEALENKGAGASAQTLAYHYARSGTPEKAVRYLEQAGDHAWAQRAHAAAEGHYRETLDRLEGLGRVQEDLRVREKLGEVLYRAARYEAAIEVLEPAMEALRTAGDWAGLGRVAVWIGRSHFRRGRPQEGITLLTALLGVAERRAVSPPPAALYAGLGQLLFTAGQYAESLARSERAAALARAGGDERTRLWATMFVTWSRVHLAQMQGRLGEALRLGTEVLALVEALGELESQLTAHRDLAYGHALQGAVTTGQGYLASALALAEQLGDPGQLALTLAVGGWLALLGGDWPGARANLDRALALSRQVERSVFTAYPLILRARLALAEGDLAMAATDAHEALALAEGHGDLQARRWAATVVAELEVQDGRPAAASARLLPLLDGPGLQDPDVTALLPALAWAQLEQGQVVQATDTVEQALARARPEEMRLVLVEALRVQALIALRWKQWKRAARSLEEGVALARSMPHPHAEARLLTVDGRRLAAQGEAGPARGRLEAALAIFRRLGARADVALTEQALSILPGAPPQAAAMHLLPPLPARPGGEEAPAGKRLTRSERQAWAFERLRADGPLAPRAYARALQVSVDTALLDLRELVDRGLVWAEGTTKDRRYVLAGDARRAGESPTTRRDSPNVSRRPQAFGESS